MIREKLRIISSREGVRWALFLGAVAVYGLLILAEAHSERFARHRWSMLWIPISIVLGQLAWRLHAPEETMTMPLSFMLPGYRESLRRSGFSRAVRWAVVASLWSFSDSWSRLLLFREVRRIYSDSPAGVTLPENLPAAPSSLEMSLSIVGGFLAGAALCLAWTNGSLVRFRRKWLYVPFVGFCLALMGVLVWSPESQRAFVVWPAVVPVSIFYCVYFWLRLGDRDWVKRGHRATILHGIEGPRQAGAQMQSRAWVEELFQSWMRKGDATTFGRHVWAWLYRRFGPILSYWRWIAIPLVVVVLVQGYISRPSLELVFLAFGTLTAASALPGTTSMLLLEGRRQKHQLAIVAAILTTAFLIAVSAVIVALSWLLAVLLPPISWGTHQWQYAGIPIGNLLLVCVPVPWVFLSGPVWHRVSTLRAVIAILAAFLAIGEISARQEGMYDGPSLLPMLLVTGWVLLPLSLWITYRRWDLVGQ